MHPAFSPRPRRARLGGLALAVACAGAVPAPATPPEGAEGALRVLEAAFRAGDADALRPVLPDHTKVLLDLESFSRPMSHYAPEQVVLIFRRIFDECAVLRFDLDRKRASPPDSRLTYVPAAWSCRNRAGGTQEARVQFLLVPDEAGRYRVREIKEVR